VRHLDTKPFKGGNPFAANPFAANPLSEFTTTAPQPVTAKLLSDATAQAANNAGIVSASTPTPQVITIGSAPDAPVGSGIAVNPVNGGPGVQNVNTLTTDIATRIQAEQTLDAVGVPS